MGNENRIPIFIEGEVQYLIDTEEAKEEFRKAYLPHWQEDSLNWSLAYLLKNKLIQLVDDDGKDYSREALQAIDNTLKLLGLKWSDVLTMLGRRARNE